MVVHHHTECRHLTSMDNHQLWCLARPEHRHKSLDWIMDRIARCSFVFWVLLFFCCASTLQPAQDNLPRSYVHACDFANLPAQSCHRVKSDRFGRTSTSNWL